MVRSVISRCLVIAGAAVLFVWLAPAFRSGDATKENPAAAQRVAGSSPTATAQPDSPGGSRVLLQFAEVPNSAALDALQPAPAREIRYVHVNRALVQDKTSPFWQAPGEGKVAFQLPSGGALTIVIDESEMLGANRFTSRGHVEGKPETRAVFAYSQGFLSASVETLERAYVLRPVTEDLSQLYEIDPERIPACGGVRRPPLEAALLQSVAQRSTGADQAGPVAEVPGTGAAAAAGKAEVHLLMVHTQFVKAHMSGAARTAALQSEFDAATAKVNNDLAASQVTARIKLVGIVETRYDENASTADKVQDNALDALQLTNDGKMDEIHALRDSLGADVVCLAHYRDDTASMGLSFIMEWPTIMNASYGTSNAEYAFAVVHYGSIAGTAVLSHELGHVFGCTHARGDSGTGTEHDAAYSFSYGYRFFGRDGLQYRDIMAYAPGFRLPYFSNPNVMVPAPVSAAIGVARGQPNEADCAYTIERNAFEVSMYRLQAQAAPAGTLINVSTRAYVGTGDAVLIGGFVIDGVGQKRILVRAAGPALGAYGVPGTLSNPILRVHSGGTVVAENDNWGQPNGAAVAQAAIDAGAFSFPLGSADSGTVVTLGKGAYSAVVEGVGGVAGQALVEVYDVDRAGSKVVNLATRGYADKGKEMFAGFVVTGGGSDTKRILIRVLGPTLERSYGVTGGMYDPLLELHSQETGLLMKNDDWSSGTTTGTVSLEDDFKPQVKHYGEKQIFETGFAPPNRREPCVMLDLPPGSYSAVIQPFESTDASAPQPAKPGVAIVEVYEIAK